MGENEKARGNGGASPRVNFDYIKGQHFRVIHMDGAIGAITPNGHIHMSLYNERPAIPRRTVFPLENGQLGAELINERTTRDAIVREMDVDVIMTVDAADSLWRWLKVKVDELRERQRIEREQEHDNE